MTYNNDTEAMLSREFWESTCCHVAEGGLAHIQTARGSVAFQTSGSTGVGKWIVIGKDGLLISARAVNAWMDVDADSVWGLSLPVSHVGGFGVIARAYAAGCRFSSFAGKWDARLFLEWVAREGVTHVSLVPAQIHDLLEAGLKGCPSLRAVVVGGGRLPDAVGQAARDCGWPVLASYGMTEAASQVATQRMDSLGKRFADCPLELLPIWEADVTEAGLLRLKGDALYAGFIEGGDFHSRKGEWFTTSDRAELSGKTIRPLGRADSMVKILGELVDVEAVEKRLAELCGARADGVAVLTVPDDRKGFSLVAVFEAEGLESAVVDYNSNAPGPERIGRWCAVTHFPRSELGKLRRAELQDLCADSALR